MKYDCLLFDADNTLLDFDRAEYLSFGYTARAAGLGYSDELYFEYSQINSSLWKKLEKKEITLDKLKTERFRILLMNHGYGSDESAPLAAEMKNLYMGELSRHGETTDGAAEILGYFHGRCRIAVCTNGIAEIQHGRLNASGLLRYADGLFISEEIGAVKPSRAYFDIVFAQFGIKDKSGVLMIGDSLTSDCDGAIEYGIDICRYNPGSLSDEGRILTYSIKHLDELKQIVENGKD